VWIGAKGITPRFTAVRQRLERDVRHSSFDQGLFLTVVHDTMNGGAAGAIRFVPHRSGRNAQ